MKRNCPLPPSRNILLVFFLFLVYYGADSSSKIGKTFTSSPRPITVMVNDTNYLWVGTNGEGLLRLDKKSGAATAFTSGNSGLPNNCVQALALDRRKRLLIGTGTKSIIRFNGSQWERLPDLPDYSMGALAVDSQGAIWAGISNSIVRLKGDAWETVVNGFGIIFGIRMITDANGALWLINVSCNSDPCNDGGIYEFVNGELQSSLPLGSLWTLSEYPTVFTVDREKNAWIGTETELIKVNKQASVHYAINDRGFPRKYVSALAVDRHDRILIALSKSPDTSQIAMYDQANGAGQPLDSIVLTYGNLCVTTACADVQEGFWLGASNGTVIKLNEVNHDTFLLAGDSYLPNNAVSSLIVDKRNIIWLGTSRGVGKYKDSAWTFSPSSGDSLPGTEVSALAMDSSGTVWAGFQQSPVSSMSNCGLSFFNGQHWRMQERGHIPITAIAFDKTNDLWVAYQNGVYRFHGMKKDSLLQTNFFDSIATAYTVAFDKSNTPWIGTGAGVKKYKNNNWITDSVLDASIQGAKVNAIVFDRSDIAWIGTEKSLIKRLGTTGMHFDTAQSFLSDNIVKCIAVDSQNSVWVGTKEGLVHINGTSHTTYTTGNTALLSNDIIAVAIDSTGNIWAGTRLGGLTVLKKNELTMTSVSDNALAFKSNALSSKTVSYRFMAPRSYCISFSVNPPQCAKLIIISLKGELIKQIHVSSSPAGIIKILWDGTNRFNRPVPPGVYVAAVILEGRIIHSEQLLQS